MKNRLETLAALALLAIIGTSSWAINPKRKEVIGAERLYSARTSSLSSHTVGGLAWGYAVTAIGGTADFEVKHSTQIEGDSTSDRDVNLSSTVYVLSGQSVSTTFGGLVFSPLIYIKRIDQPGTTVYIDIQYLAPREPGNF